MPSKALLSDIYPSLRKSDLVLAEQIPVNFQNQHEQQLLSEFRNNQNIKIKLKKTMKRQQKKKLKNGQLSKKINHTLFALIAVVFMLIEIEMMVYPILQFTLYADLTIMFLVQILLIILLYVFLNRSEAESIDKKIKKIQERYRLIQRDTVFLQNIINNESQTA